MTAPRQLTLDLVQPLKPTLENFVVGRNAEAVAALRGALEGRGERFVYLWGAAGAGRSHLLQSLAARGARHGGEFVAVPAFDPTVLVYAADDVDRYDEVQQQRLFVLLNEVRSHPEARLVAAGNAAPAQLALRDDIRTRLAWGLVYHLHALTDEEKSQALLAHGASRGLALAPDVVAFLLSRLPRDMRTLTAVLDALDTHALAQQRALTVPLIREWLRESAGPAA
jgi:DnaA regulatory inactivator Hda